MYSSDDNESILDSVKLIREKIPNINVIEFSDKGHFTEPDLKSKEFPELLEIILK
jgi:hypothetical protein